MKRHLFSIVVLSVAAAILFWGLQAQAANIVIKVGHGHTAEHSYQLGLQQAAKSIAERTSGRITMKFFPSAQLGDEKQMQESLTTGTLEMTITGLANIYDPAFALFDFPYLYDNRNQIKNVMYSPLMEQMGEALQKKGMRIIGLMEVGFRNVTSNKPINTPADLKGFKIRTPQSPAQIETFKALGAIPTPMSFSELYGALQSGVVDGQENPLENILNGKLFEVQKYCAFTRHIYNFAYVLISEKFWNSLSKDDQKLMAEEIKKGCFWQMDYLAGKEKEMEQFLKDKGMQFTNPDRDAFRKAAAAAYESDFVKKMEPRSAEIIKKIREIVANTK
jgi:tripartite ATP-independent transporter DctP family solute receptor